VVEAVQKSAAPRRAARSHVVLGCLVVIGRDCWRIGYLD